MMLLAATIAMAAPVAARDLAVPSDKGWKHAETGLVLMPKLDGLPRTRLTDATDSEHDVAAEFADATTVATIYIYHPAVDDVAMWFERSEAAIYDRALFGNVSPASADAIPFAPPSSATKSALRRIYAPAKGRYRSTGLAIMPFGEWLVALRMSSTDATSAALDIRMSRIIVALRWPSGAGASPPPTPIAACATPLVFAKAKRQKSKGEDVLFSLLGAVVAAKDKAEGKAAERVCWCRDAASEASFGVYRNMALDKGYLLALQDAGRIINVVPSLDAQTGKGDGYNMSLTDVDGSTSSFPGFNHLPAPQQVMAALSGPQLGKMQGRTMTLDKNSLGK